MRTVSVAECDDVCCCICFFPDDSCLSHPSEITNSLQTSVTSASEISTQHEERSRQVKGCHAENNTGQKCGSDSKIFIRHDQVPLKARCTRCSFTCNNASQLELHMKTGHEPTSRTAYKLGNFKCTQCNMSTPKKEVLIWHLSHHIGRHVITYYACSSCHAERQFDRDMKRHIAKKHGKKIGALRCTSQPRVETVLYLENIMKCPACNIGLLWKGIFVEHLRDKHNLWDLARYIERNYDDKCPNILSFPRHLMKSYTEPGAELVTEVTESSETLTISRFHCENCEFSTNDSDAYRQHQSSHGQSRIESDSVRQENDASSVNTDHTLYHRAAKVKAFSQIIKPKRQHRPTRIKVKLRQKSAVLTRTASKLQESNKCSKVANAISSPVASKSIAAPPQSTSNTSFLTEFIEKLPSPFVFTEEIKCPVCNFASRVRVNLQRHIMKHVRSDETVSNKTVASESKTGESSMCLSYDLWKPYSSISSAKSAEQEPPVLQISEARNDGASDASFASLNSKDSDIQEQQTAEEMDSASPAEYTDSCPAVSDERYISGSETEDEATVEPDGPCCEMCSKEFSSDVDLERHISKVHGGPYVCHLCGVLMWQQNAVHEHYSAMHPGSPVHFEVLHKAAEDGGREVVGAGASERKIAVVQGIHHISLLYTV